MGIASRKAFGNGVPPFGGSACVEYCRRHFVDTLSLAEVMTFETLCRPLSETQWERLDSLISPAGDENRTVVRVFIKKTQKTPHREIELALKRANEVLK